MSLRDLFVGIRFEDEASKHIDKVDKSMDNVESKAKDVTDQFGLAEKNINTFGSSGKSSMDKVGTAAQDTAKQTENVDTKVKGTSSRFQNLQTIGVGAWVAVGAAGVAAATGIVAAVGEQEAAMSRMAAKTGLAGAELAGMQDTVKNVFNAGIGTDLLTVADDVTMIKSSLKGLEGKELESFSKQALTVADLWGQGSDSVVWAVKNMTSNFDGLSEHEALDLITVGFQKTGDYAGDLLDTFKEYSPYFSKMGLSAQEFTGILVTGAEQGAWNLDKVADAVKEFGIRGMDGSKATADGFKAIGLESDHMAKQIAAGGETANQAFYATIAGLAAMDDEVARNQAGVALFGTQWEDVREEVILSMADAKTAVQDFEGASQKATDTSSNNVRSQLTSAWREFKTELTDVFATGEGKQLTAGIVDGFTSALGVAKSFAGFIANNWGLVTNTVIGLGTAVGTFALIMGGLKVIGLINTLMMAYRAGTLMATAAQLGLNVAMLANPVTWVVAGIAALVGIGVVLYRNWDLVKTKAGELWGVIKQNPLILSVAGPFGTIIGLGIMLYKNWDTIKEKAGELWQTTKDKFAGIKTNITNAVDPVVSLFESLNSKWSTFKSAISNFKLPKWVSTVGDAISNGINKLRGGGADGSHATGLASVPFDGYRAELHKGEAVLTAKQSNALRTAGILSENGNGTPNVDMQASTTPVPFVNNQNAPSGSKTISQHTFNITVNAGDKASEIASTIKKVVTEMIVAEMEALEG